MSRLNGKVAIVTGAGMGQGEAEARLLADLGAKVVATDVNFENVSRVVDEINAGRPDSALALRQNVAERDQWTIVVEQAVSKFGPVTVLVNNAGIFSKMTYDTLSHAHWQDIMDVNAWGQFAGIQAVVPGMRAAGVGSIINVGSLAVVNACGRLSAYTASKGAVDAFSRAAAIELAGFNIRVNCINPGVIHTSMVEEAFPTPEAMAAAAAVQPLKRFGRPVDVAYLVAYLASDESWFTTGASIVIDGGLSVEGGVRPVIAGN
jgi:NAD(P)-dependent dehydrogenase (short-subunit alcohol dehydrogenase family)